MMSTGAQASSLAKSATETVALQSKDNPLFDPHARFRTRQACGDLSFRKAGGQRCSPYFKNRENENTRKQRDATQSRCMIAAKKRKAGKTLLGHDHTSSPTMFGSCFFSDELRRPRATMPVANPIGETN